MLLPRWRAIQTYTTNPRKGASMYSPKLATWMEPDQKDYVDGPDRYQFVRSNPPKYLDPQGEAATDTRPTMQPSGIIVSTLPGGRHTYHTQPDTDLLLIAHKSWEDRNTPF